MKDDLKSPDVPTFYFVGMTTSRSSIMKVFPDWVKHLGLNTLIVGIDCKWHDSRERYREIVHFLKSEPNAVGGLVTTHKMDLLAAARDMFDGLGNYAGVLGEISSISKRDGKLWGTREGSHHKRSFARSVCPGGTLGRRRSALSAGGRGLLACHDHVLHGTARAESAFQDRNYQPKRAQNRFHEGDPRQSESRNPR